jgi:hypothetical protein
MPNSFQELIPYFNGIEYMLLVFSVLIVGSIARQHGTFYPVFTFVRRLTGSDKLALASVSMLSGSLPVAGRVSITAPVIFGVTRSKQAGVVDYLATHHYYLWSPIEKSVIIILAGLGLTYAEFMSYTWPLLLAYVLYFGWFLYRQEIKLEIKDQSINFDFVPFIAGIVFSLFYQSYYVFPFVAAYYVFSYREYNILKHINWNVVFWVAAVIVLANIVKSLELQQYATNVPNWMIYFVGFGLSFAMGSSSKYAGLTVILIPFVGIQNFALLFAAEYAGYLMSPMHKCTVIAKTYFGTPLHRFYGHLAVISLVVIVVAAATLPLHNMFISPVAAQ